MALYRKTLLPQSGTDFIKPPSLGGMLLSSGGSSDPTKPPPFHPVDPQATQDLALNFDEAGYNLSDQDFAKRFPQLQAGRQFAVNDALSNLEGKDSANFTKTMQGAGLGDTNFGSTSFQKSHNMGATGTDILSREKRDRNYFQNLLASNPQRVFGLQGQDVAHIALANTNSQNVFNQGQYGSRVAQYNQQVAQNAANTAAYSSAGNSLLGDFAKMYSQPNESSLLSAQGYGSAPTNYQQGQYDAFYNNLSGGY